MIYYTQEMVDAISNASSMYFIRDEDMFYYIKKLKILPSTMHLSTFKEHIALSRKERLENIEGIEEEKENKRLRNDFYENADTLRHSGVSSLTIKSFTGAMQDDTGRTAIDFLSKIHIKNQPIKIDAEVTNKDDPRAIEELMARRDELIKKHLENK